MSYGGYSGEAHRAFTSRRASLPREEVFTQRACHPEMNPFGLKFREARDSALHPNSLGLILALDETGSMGDIPEMLAKEELPKLMELGLPIIPDLQLMMMGIGDAHYPDYEKAPLQVGQFEAEAHLMDKWLTGIFLEGKGGGNLGESYELAFYTAARHTALDSWEKRRKKGYLIVTGDEPPFETVQASQIKRLIGTDLARDISMKEIVAEVSKTYHPFFLIPDLNRARRCESQWREVLGDHVICLSDPHDTCPAVAMILGLTESVFVNLEAAANKLKELGKERAQINRVIRAVEPYAASIGRGGERRATQDADLPTGKGTSGTRRSR